MFRHGSMDKIKIVTKVMTLITTPYTLSRRKKIDWKYNVRGTYKHMGD